MKLKQIKCQSSVLLMLSVLGFMFLTSIAACADPSVIVTAGNPGDPYIYDDVTCAVSVSYNNPPQASKEGTIVPEYFWYMGSSSGGTVSVDNVNAATSTFHGNYTDPGYYTAQVNCDVVFVDTYTGQTYGPYTGSDSVGDTGFPTGAAMHANVSLRPNDAAPPGKNIYVKLDVTTGGAVKLGLGSLNGASNTVTATITPVEGYGKVSFPLLNKSDYSTGNSEATIKELSHKTVGDSVVVTLQATAASMTPASTGGSADAAIVPEVKGKPVYPVGSTTPTHADVLVLVPYSLKQASYKGTVYGTNFLENNKSAPADTTVIFPQVRLVTLYNTPLSMQVYDQFGKALDPIFTGTQVSEVFGTNSGNINSPITVAGTYLDSVGNPVVSDNIEANNTTDKAKAWIKTDAPYLSFAAIGSLIQHISVSVGGQVLHPDPAVNRTVAVSPTVPPSPTSAILTVTPM